MWRGRWRPRGARCRPSRRWTPRSRACRRRCCWSGGARASSLLHWRARRTSRGALQACVQPVHNPLQRKIDDHMHVDIAEAARACHVKEGADGAAFCAEVSVDTGACMMLGIAAGRSAEPRARCGGAVSCKRVAGLQVAAAARAHPFQGGAGGARRAAGALPRRGRVRAAGALRAGGGPGRPGEARPAAERHEPGGRS